MSLFTTHTIGLILCGKRNDNSIGITKRASNSWLAFGDSLTEAVIWIKVAIIVSKWSLLLENNKMYENITKRLVNKFNKVTRSDLERIVKLIFERHEKQVITQKLDQMSLKLDNLFSQEKIDNLKLSKWQTESHHKLVFSNFIDDEHRQEM